MINTPISAIVKQALDEHVFPGCVAGIVNAKGDKQILPFGHCTDEPDARAMHADALFDVASITKAIPTSSLLLRLIDNKTISVHDRLMDILPELHGPWRSEITIHHLLTHTLDFGFRLSALKDQPPSAILNTILSAPLRAKPGSTFFYSNATSILTGLAVEKLYAKRLDVAAHEYFFKPLGMNDTTFFPTPNTNAMTVPTEIDTWRNKTICGEVHDESAAALRPDHIAGSAGLFSTAQDLLTFCEMLLNNGSLNGHTFFSTQLIESIQTNQLAALGLSAGLGWELNQGRYMGKRCPPWRIGKTGFTGCVIIIDIPAGRAFTLLSNYTYPHRKNGADAINNVRALLADAVFDKPEFYQRHWRIIA